MKTHALGTGLFVSLIMTMGSVRADEMPYATVAGNMSHAVTALSDALDKVLPALDLIDQKMARMETMVGAMEKEKITLKQFGHAVGITDEVLLPLTLSFLACAEPLLALITDVTGILKAVQPTSPLLKQIESTMAPITGKISKLPDQIKKVQKALPDVKEKLGLKAQPKVL